MAEKETKEILLTKAGYEEKAKELEYLQSTKREEIAERLKQAIAFGDLSENSEYDDAKDEQAHVERRISELEYILRHARVIEETDGNVVSLGSRVLIRELSRNREITMTLVDSSEANRKEMKISKDSPVGMAILGKEVGTTVKVDAPSGTLKYEIVEILKD